MASQAVLSAPPCQYKIGSVQLVAESDTLLAIRELHVYPARGALERAGCPASHYLLV